MSLLDNTIQNNELENDYHFTDGSIDDFVEELNTEKQETGAEIEPDEEFEAYETEIEEEDSDDPRTKQQSSNDLSKVLTGVIGGSIATLMGLVAQSDPEPFQLSKEDNKTLNVALKNYLMTTNLQISPGAALLMAIVQIYSPKTLTMVQMRKKNKATNIQIPENNESKESL